MLDRPNQQRIKSKQGLVLVMPTHEGGGKWKRDNFRAVMSERRGSSTDFAGVLFMNRIDVYYKDSLSGGSHARFPVATLLLHFLRIPASQRFSSTHPHLHSGDALMTSPMMCWHSVSSSYFTSQLSAVDPI